MIGHRFDMVVLLGLGLEFFTEAHIFCASSKFLEWINSDGKQEKSLRCSCGNRQCASKFRRNVYGAN